MHYHAERGNDRSSVPFWDRLRRRADLLQRPVDEQLPKLSHLLNSKHDCALGSVQIEGQVAGERVKGGQGFAGVDQQGFGVLGGVFG